MTRYFTGLSGECLHVWDGPGARESYGEAEPSLRWPCGGSKENGNPAACGHRRDCFVGPLDARYDSLVAFLESEESCPRCAAALVERHNIPLNRLPSDAVETVLPEVYGDVGWDHPNCRSPVTADLGDATEATISFTSGP